MCDESGGACCEDSAVCDESGGSCDEGDACDDGVACDEGDACDDGVACDESASTVCPSHTFSEAKQQFQVELESCREMFLSALRKKESLHLQGSAEQQTHFQKQVDQGMVEFNSHYEIEKNSLKEFVRTKTQELEDQLDKMRRQDVQHREKKLREATQTMMDRVFEIRSEFGEVGSIQ